MHWIEFNKWCAERSARGQVRRTGAAQAYWAQTALIVNNLTIPAEIPGSADELLQCAKDAVTDASRHGLPWMFGLADPMLAGLSLEEANTLLSSAGLHHMMYMTVMECEGPLAEPVRPLPADVQAIRVTTEQHVYDALDLNSKSYGMPDAVTRDVLDAKVYYTDREREFGFVVYNADGLAVSTAGVVLLNGWAYVCAVATHPEHRQKGYAEVAMRAAVQAAGADRTALDASRMGEPLYAQMGYQRRYKWNFWISAG